jgi:hypothetical protein
MVEKVIELSLLKEVNENVEEANKKLRGSM